MGETFQQRAARTDVNWIAVIRLADGAEVPCSVKDVSSTGMKVCVSADLTLPETFTLKVVGRDLVFRVKRTWRRQHQMGVLIEKIAKLPKPPEAASPPEARSAEAGQHTSLGSRERYRTGL